MEELHQWLNEQIDQRKVEPNSSLGEAIRYLLKHWEPLTLFLRRPDPRITVPRYLSAAGDRRAPRRLLPAPRRLSLALRGAATV